MSDGFGDVIDCKFVREYALTISAKVAHAISDHFVALFCRLCDKLLPQQ